MNLLIKGGNVVTSEAVFPADVLVEKGVITSVGLDIQAADVGVSDSPLTVIDASGKYVAPGGVDIHSHMQYKVGDYTTCDDFASGTRAAAYGGTTTVVDFVEAKPQERLLDALERRKQEALGHAFVDFSLHMSVLPTDIGKMGQFKEVVDSGCPTFKHYMAYAFELNDAQLFRSFESIKQAGGMAVVHAENWQIIQQLIGRAVKNGDTHPRNHPLCRPATLEAEAVRRAIEIARLTDTEIFLFHLTCIQAIEEVKKARSLGIKVSAETCPHYTVLDSELFELIGPLLICAPPVREKAQMVKVAQALVDGDLLSCSSDHCPFSKADKFSKTIFSQVPGGISSSELRCALIMSLPGMTLPRWAQVCCANPAKIAGLNKKGTIAAGFDGDIAVWNLDKEREIDLAGLHSKADWTPYAGMTVKGFPETVISRGKIVVDKDRCLADASHGKYVERRLIR